MVSENLTPAERCERFQQIVNLRFRFLAATYGLASAETGCMSGEMWVSIRGSVSQVDVYFAYGHTDGTGNSIWLTVGRADGERFNLDDLLHLRAPQRERSMLFAGFDPEFVDEILQERSTALREYADDLLRGDFSIFPKLRDVMTKRNTKWSRI